MGKLRGYDINLDDESDYEEEQAKIAAEKAAAEKAKHDKLLVDYMPAPDDPTGTVLIP